MSSRPRVYVGPYLAVPQVMQQIEGPSLAQCKGNPKHKVDSRMKFCPHCGKPVTVTKREDLKPVSIRVYDIDGADDLVYRAEYCVVTGVAGVKCDVWVSNTSLFGQHLEDAGIVATLDSSKHFCDEGVAFREMIAPIINEIEKQYGVEAIVGHGIVSYWD